MNLNLHPIIVHFPVALATVYCIAELLRFRFIHQQAHWFYLKATLAIIAALGTLAATATGDSAVHALRSGSFHSPLANARIVIEMHENFAHITTLIFLFIAACYLFAWIDKSHLKQKLNHDLARWWNKLEKIVHFLIETPFAIVLALIALAAISITGGLGGAIVYGSNADPFIKFVLNILAPQ